MTWTINGSDDLILRTHRSTTIAATGESVQRRWRAGSRGVIEHAARVQFDAARNLYIAERDNHVVRKVDARTGVISTFAGTGVAGFSGDGGPAARAQLRQPHSIAVDPEGPASHLRYRESPYPAGGFVQRHHRDLWRHRRASTDARWCSGEGDAVKWASHDRHRLAMAISISRFARAMRFTASRRRPATIHHVAGTGEQGYSGDGGPARVASLAGPKGLAYGRGNLYVADTENHVVRRIDLTTGIITTVLGTGRRGDGPEPDPLRCALARPHGVFVDAAGILYVGDSEAHRIRVLT